MDAKKMSIATLLYQKMPFVVPKYQRAYAWEDDEITDFANDITKLYNSRISNNTPRKHFFGGLVSINHQNYEVIDGQQRLTTFMITISLMLNAFDNIAKQADKEGNINTKTKAEEHKNEDRRDFFQYRDIEALKDRMRLMLSKADRVFFEQMVTNISNLPKPQRESHKRLINALKKIRDLIFNNLLENKQYDAQEKLNRLLVIRSCLLDDCYIIHIASDNKHEAYQLFTTLNDRGKSLSTGDLLRARSLELLEDYELLQEQVELYWDSILMNKQSEIDHFLESYYASYKGERASSRNIFDDYISLFFNYNLPLLDDSHNQIEHRVQNIKLENEVFLKLKEGEWPFEVCSASIWQQDRLYRLIRVLKHEVSLPLLLAAACHLSEKDFIDIINIIERFAFRYVNIVGAHIGSASDKYNKTSVDIRSNNYKFSELESSLRDLLASNASDTVFAASLPVKLRYNKKSSQQNRIVKHFLSTIEDFSSWIANGSSGKPKKIDQTKSFDLNQLTVEHIYPQNAQIPITNLQPLINELGNLTILGPENSSLGNKIFIHKKNEYAKSHISITKELALLNDWTPGDIDLRMQGLIDKALKIFII